MGKKALLVVSFGTSHIDALEKNITAVEQAVAEALPEHTLFRAFTSGMIIRKLSARDGLTIDDVPSALERIAGEGYVEVAVQPTHILNGDEYEKLISQAEPYRERFASMTFGAPLLTSSDDYKACAGAIMEEIDEPAADEAVVFMGHGSGHYANSAYALFEYVLHDLGWKRAYVGTVEGYPELNEVVRRLGENPEIKRLRLYPLMVVAGDHAKNDLAGDEEDSWKMRLISAGYEVECVLCGLGENSGIHALFAEHAINASKN